MVPTAYQQPAPAFEAKIIKQGYTSYLVVRSNDQNWLKNVHSYTLPVNQNYTAGGMVIADNIDLGSWSHHNSRVFSHTDGKMSNGLVIKAYGYENAKLK